jgi:hypothetical protein
LLSINIHQQDDILIARDNINDVADAMDVIIKTFIDYGFTIRGEICEEPSNSSVFVVFKLLVMAL